jgi:hypothetical protein
MNFKKGNLELDLHFHKVVGRRKYYRYTLSIDNKIVCSGKDYAPSQFIDALSMPEDCLDWIRSTVAMPPHHASVLNSVGSPQGS